MKSLMKIIKTTAVILSVPVIAGLLICAVFDDEGGVKSLVITLLIFNVIVLISAMGIKKLDQKEKDDKERIEYMTINHLCPSNCKYIVNGKCIATECKRKLGEYEDDDTETS